MLPGLTVTFGTGVILLFALFAKKWAIAASHAPGWPLSACCQPGYVARECREAWSASRVAPVAPASSAATPASAHVSSAVTASSAEASSSDVPLASDAAPADLPPSAAVSAAPLSVLLPSAALALEDEGSDMDFVPAPVADNPEPVASKEMCSDDEKVIREAAAAAAATTVDALSSPRGHRRSRVRLPDLVDGSCESYIHFGDQGASVFEDNTCFERLHLVWYEDYPDSRPCVWLPTTPGMLPPPPPDLPPSLFSVYVPFVE